MDDVYRRRQLEEGGPDPFQDARLPESDPAASAAGDGRRDEEASVRARELVERKHEEHLRIKGAPRPVPHQEE